MSAPGSGSPLAIASVAWPAGDGRIGLCAAPGGSASALERRDLGADLDALLAWGAGSLVTLIEDHEFALLGVEDLAGAVAARGLRWHHLPIIDGAAPGGRFERGWRRAGPALHAELEAGGRVAVHCLAGVGRSGTVAARLLVERGMTPGDALAHVRQARPGAVESPEQRAFLDALGQEGGSGRR